MENSAALLVLKLGPDGQETDHPFIGDPCIEIGFSFGDAQAKKDGTTERVFSFGTRGLLDTGANYNLIDSRLIPNDAKQLETVESRGISGAVNTKTFAITLALTKKLWLNTMVASWEPDNRSLPYQLILGRNFLQLCRFTYDRHNGIKELLYSSDTTHAV